MTHASPDHYRRRTAVPVVGVGLPDYDMLCVSVPFNAVERLLQAHRSFSRRAASNVDCPEDSNTQRYRSDMVSMAASETVSGRRMIWFALHASSF